MVLQYKCRARKPHTSFIHVSLYIQIERKYCGFLESRNGDIKPQSDESHIRIALHNPPYITGLHIAQYNKVVHQIVHVFKSNNVCYTLVNVGNQHIQPQDIGIAKWLIQCTSCFLNTCTCMARPRPNMLCILGVHVDSHTPIPQNPIKNPSNSQNSPTPVVDSQVLP